MRVLRDVRVWLAALFVTIIIALRFSGIGQYFTIDNIKIQRDYLQQFVAFHYWQSILAYIATYAVSVSFSLPIAAVLTVTAGFLYGTLLGVVYANIGATLGAIVAFLIVRHLIGGTLQKRYADQLAGFNDHMHKEGTLYLITIHFIAVIPFFVINILAGLTKVPLWTFIWTTSIGILPGSFVFTFAGQQLNTIDSVRDVFSLKIIIAFALLALLAFIPNLVKKYWK